MRSPMCVFAIFDSSQWQLEIITLVNRPSYFVQSNRSQFKLILNGLCWLRKNVMNFLRKCDCGPDRPPVNKNAVSKWCIYLSASVVNQLQIYADFFSKREKQKVEFILVEVMMHTDSLAMILGEEIVSIPTASTINELLAHTSFFVIVIAWQVHSASIFLEEHEAGILQSGRNMFKHSMTIFGVSFETQIRLAALMRSPTSYRVLFGIFTCSISVINDENFKC